MIRDSALLVIVYFKKPSGRHWEDDLNELSELTRSAGGKICAYTKAPIERPTPNFFVHRGKIEEIRKLVYQQKTNLVIFNIDLSPLQARNIERETGARIVDRTGLILDIFARRARSGAGKLQVELAQLNYMLPRLVGQGVIMSRLGGGIGTRGPGEQKLEVDRRKIRKRIDHLKDELEKLRNHRELIRKNRKRKSLPVVSIVGYTNAGKSTLLNALTGADALVEDKLFATLDPLTRSFRLPSGVEILLTDTVGFIVQLPHSLVEAFHATLEEVTESDALIHVLDVSHPLFEQNYTSVCQVLEELKAQEKPTVLALNKIDLLNENQRQSISRRFPDGVFVSARSKTNLNVLSSKLLKVLKITT